jgi:hypothetical protein
MPIDDERWSLGFEPDAKPQTAFATGGLGLEGGIQGSLQRLRETLLLQRDGQAESRMKAEKRTEANKQAVQRAQSEKHEMHRWLQRPFEWMSPGRDEEKAEAARPEELKGVKGARRLFYLDKDLVQYN